jgi:acetyl-CoA synthetase
VAKQSTSCPVEWVDSEAPLFLLYTSGSTGQPKGILHTTGGYMIYSATTFKYTFDWNEEQRKNSVFWCTADCGWITGHSYIAYGPMLNGASQVIFEGVPSYPDAGRCWDVVDKYKVSAFYTAPTAIRALMREGDSFVKRTSRKSLRILGTVGEPINPEAWRWYADVVGNGKCPIVDTWWQTETAGHAIVNLPGVSPQVPGSAQRPFFGCEPVILDEKGNELSGACEGMLCIKSPWPSTMRTVFGDQKRFETAYFAPFEGYYFSGDGARRDADGNLWITGRVDDVLNVSGHRIGTAEVESALVLHPKCSEAAVIGVEHPVKGQAIYAFVTLMEGVEPSEELRQELRGMPRKQIGPFAGPDTIQWAPGLPKTRSGKIMRRILRKVASGESDFGDTSTLADPGVVDQLVATKPK